MSGDPGHTADALRALLHDAGLSDDDIVDAVGKIATLLKPSTPPPAPAPAPAPATRRELQREFLAQLARRLDQGADDYGEGSLVQPLPRTADEILTELVDIAGWSFIAWVKLKQRLGRVVLLADLHGRGTPP